MYELYFHIKIIKKGTKLIDEFLIKLVRTNLHDSTKKKTQNYEYHLNR